MEHHLGQAHEDTCEDMHEAQRDSFLPPGHTAERGKTAFGSGSTHLIKSQGFFFLLSFFSSMILPCLAESGELITKNMLF